MGLDVSLWVCLVVGGGMFGSCCDVGWSLRRCLSLWGSSSWVVFCGLGGVS